LASSRDGIRPKLAAKRMRSGGRHMSRQCTGQPRYFKYKVIWLAHVYNVP
jgi:hypothetical protein